MSDAFLDSMTNKEYNDYHRRLFNEKKFNNIQHRKTIFTFIERIKMLFAKGEKTE